MNQRILNRDFQHPADGWYQIEALGNHPNRAAGLVQVIDAQAAQSIVDRFNADASAGQLRHGNEMLIDHEHFSDLPDQETRAYGWLQELQNRDDGIYGRIRWTGTGRTAVDGGDYRFFSTEYDPQDLKVVNSSSSSSSSSRLVRPTRLAGLTLTNMNNNRGQKPITNRGQGSQRNDGQGNKNSDIHSSDNHSSDQSHFAGSRESADSTNTNKTAPNPFGATKVKNKMKTVCTLLGLSADADEASVHAAVSKLLNRGDITPDALAALRAEHKTLGETNQTLLGEQLTGLLAEHGIKDAKVINRLTPVLTPLKNREERLSCLSDLGFKASSSSSSSSSSSRVLNRGGKVADETAGMAGADDKAVAQKIRNRANDLKGASPKRSFDDCWNQASQEISGKN